ncbi:DUF2177 family protein [Anaerorhabdus sp.]|uniref:DUF2177 family protein n=1 Tax=Anaerorhabdus sp. TaxID=1872524 RepID=UPI002FC9DBF9
MLFSFKHYIITFIVFIVLDAIWLFSTKGFYAKELQHLMATDIKWVSALLFYLLFVVALLYFVIMPALSSHDIKTMILSAILFGLITYGTYDLTNYATINNWPLSLTIIDLIWGSSVSVLTSLIAYFILK